MHVTGSASNHGHERNASVVKADCSRDENPDSETKIKNKKSGKLCSTRVPGGTIASTSGVLQQIDAIWNVNFRFSFFDSGFSSLLQSAMSGTKILRLRRGPVGIDLQLVSTRNTKVTVKRPCRGCGGG